MQGCMLGSDVFTTCVHYLSLFCFNSELKKIFPCSKKIYKSSQLNMAGLPYRFNSMSNVDHATETLTTVEKNAIDKAISQMLQQAVDIP